MTGGEKDKVMEEKKTVGEKDKEVDDRKTYKQAFDDFDWNRNGTIPTRVMNSNSIVLFSRRIS